MDRYNKLFLIFVAIFLMSLQAMANSTPECQTQSLGEISFRYCVFAGDRAQNQDVIYFFHGAGGNELQWSTPGTLGRDPLMTYWKNHNIPIPTVVSISFDLPKAPPHYWVVNDFPAPGYSRSLRSVIENDLFKAVENKWPLGNHGQRILLGTSMGGYNVLSLWLHSPHLYHKTAALCPGVSTLNPFASDTELNQFIKDMNTRIDEGDSTSWFKHKGVSPGLVKLYREIWSPFFPDKQAWEQHNLQKSIQESSMYQDSKLYVVYNWRDPFSFGPPTADLVKTLNNKNIQVEVESNNNQGHCSEIYTDALAEFLTNHS